MENMERCFVNKFNKTTLRIWTSESNPRKPGGTGNQGHVSLEPPYISFVPNHDWQTDSDKSVLEKAFGTPQGAFQISVANDVRDEECEPQYTFHFYKLDQDKMKIKFAQFKHEKPDLLWTLSGDAFLADKYHSCASFIWTILCAGGIQQFIPTGERLVGSLSESTTASGATLRGALTSNVNEMKGGSMYSAEYAVDIIGIKSPDVLVTYLEIAKKNELKMFPATKEFDTPAAANAQKSFLDNPSTGIFICALFVAVVVFFIYNNS